MSIWDREDRVERLKKLRTEGKSASEIAKLLGHGITKNAVLGKLDRLGLLKQDLPSRPKTPRPMAQRPALLPKPKPKAMPPTVSAATGVRYAGPEEARDPFLPPTRGDAFKPLPGSQPVAWERRTAMQCSWPIDNEHGYPAHACGNRIPEGGRWCLAHNHLGISVNQPPPAKRLERMLRRAAA